MSALYLTNAASRRQPQRGPGRVFTIMASPRPGFGEFGLGPVAALVPPAEWVRAAKIGTMPMEAYREKYLLLLEMRRHLLLPGVLAGPAGVLVEGGDTLLCACSRAAALDGRCHRCWAGRALLRAGWDVVLDGMPLIRREVG